jgi:hypothetical protein
MTDTGDLGDILGKIIKVREEVDDDEEMEEENENFDDYEEEPLKYYGDDIQEDEVFDIDIDINTKKESLNILFRSEKTALIGIRAEQLQRGMIPTVELSTVKRTKTSSNICFDIAEEELKQGKLPLSLGRQISKNKKEIWLSSQLIDLEK